MRCLGCRYCGLWGVYCTSFSEYLVISKNGAGRLIVMQFMILPTTAIDAGLELCETSSPVSFRLMT